MAYRHGRFVWFELVTPAAEDAAAFWTEVALLGTAEMSMGPAGTYRMLTRDGKNQAGVVAPQMPGVPPHWLSYLSVDDVDGKHLAVAAHGGRSIVGPTDIPGIGRFAVVADPGGAVLALFKGAESDDGAATAFVWNELWAEDPTKALAFYEAVFGFTSEVMAMPTGTYYLLKQGDQSVAGLMASPKAGVPPMWLPYLEVEDADRVVERVRGHGGAVHAEPMSVENVGRFAIVADRQGAVLGVIRSAAR